MTPEQEALLAALRTAWEDHPQLRLTQLIVNAINPATPAPQIYYVSDGVLRDLLQHYRETHR